MIFLYPQFLFALLALVIPIIIHLFNFRKTKRIFFSNSQLLKNVKEASSAKRKLKHYLVLAARMFFIAFLVLAFAQPFIPAADEKQQANNLLIYLDNSYSMSNEVQSEANALELAINYIQEIIDQHPASTRFVYVDNSFAATANSEQSKEQLQENITEVKFSNVSRSLNEVTSKISQVLEDQPKGTQVYLISDFQKSTLGGLGKFIKDSTAMFNLIHLPYTVASNVSVDSVFLTNPFLLNERDNQLEVLFYNSGAESVDDLIVTLHVNGAQVANASVDIPSEGTAAIAFPLNFPLQKNNACTIRFEDFPVTFDNEFYFALNKADPVSILEIKEVDGVTNLEKVFANPDLFRFSSFPVGGIDYSQLPRADLVILNEVNDISPSFLKELTDYVASGGNILLIPAEKSATYVANLFPRNAALGYTVNQTNENLAAPDFANPFFEHVFDEKNTGIEMPYASQTLNWRNAADNILSFKNGSPYFSVFSSPTAGSLYVVASPLKDAYTNFHRHALFVPTMYRLASLSKTGSERLYFSASEPIMEVRLDSINKNGVFKLQGETQQVIPDQRASGNKLVMELPRDLLNVGHYDIIFENDVKKKVALNFDKAESRLDQHSLEDVKTAFSGHDNIRVIEQETFADFGKALKEDYFGKPLWKYAILISLICLLLEVLIIRFYKG